MNFCVLYGFFVLLFCVTFSRVRITSPPAASQKLQQAADPPTPPSGSQNKVGASLAQPGQPQVVSFFFSFFFKQAKSFYLFFSLGFFFEKLSSQLFIIRRFLSQGLQMSKGQACTGFMAISHAQVSTPPDGCCFEVLTELGFGASL